MLKRCEELEQKAEKHVQDLVQDLTKDLAKFREEFTTKLQTRETIIQMLQRTDEKIAELTDLVALFCSTEQNRTLQP